jgi:hypothetical protein
MGYETFAGDNPFLANSWHNAMSVVGFDNEDDAAPAFWLADVRDFDTLPASLPLYGDVVAVIYQAGDVAKLAFLLPAGSAYPAGLTPLDNAPTMPELADALAVNPSTPAGFDWGTPFP